MPKSPTNNFFLVALSVFFTAASLTHAIDPHSTARPGGFQFDGKISRPVLENYLARSICIEGLLNGRGRVFGAPEAESAGDVFGA